jgi:hypothetical protein
MSLTRDLAASGVETRLLFVRSFRSSFCLERQARFAQEIPMWQPLLTSMVSSICPIERSIFLETDKPIYCHSAASPIQHL